MRRSSTLNIGCILLLSASVLLFFNGRTWLGLLCVALGAVLGVMAGQAMTTEPRNPADLGSTEE
ncbi:MAG: hypothetical protein IPM90_11315 [Austwickia sp.]|nr:hypothetical protein [Austwickia sp.]